MNHFMTIVKSLLVLFRDYERGHAPYIGLSIAPYNGCLIANGVSLPFLSNSPPDVVFISHRKKNEVNIEYGTYLTNTEEEFN